MSTLDRWDHPQRSEPMIPPPMSIASVLALGLAALSLAGMGLVFRLFFGRKGRHESAQEGARRG